jgi:DNA-binding NtrC family response regulator
MESFNPSKDHQEGESLCWSILVVSDQLQFLEDLRGILLKDKVRVVGAPDPKKATPCLSEEVFHLLVFSVCQLQREERIFLQKAMETDESLPVFLLIENWEQLAEIREIVHPATWTVLIRPQPLEHVRAILKTALDRIRLQREVQYLRHREPYIYRFDRIVGEGPQILQVLSLVKKVAPSDATILIQGESGTGKELIAAAIHFNSPRKEAPFVAVNCAALQENLLESELFGHEKGAFTGADRQRIGRFEQANGGTLFLDEIGDMSPTVQAKVLRVLQEKAFERLGGSKTIRVDVRILAATNQNLRNAIRERLFREDLYYRLSVVPVYLPPLRDRQEDIQPLSESFLRKYRGPDREIPLGFHPDALASLQTYHWPGNVRELENVVERAILVSQEELIMPHDLMLATAEVGPKLSDSVQLPPGGVKLEEVERDLIIQALSRSHGVQKKAAQLLGISPRAIHYKIRKHGIQYPTSRS